MLVVEESTTVDRFVGVSASNVCMTGRGTPQEKLQGFVVLKTAVGNGEDKEGFVALQIDRVANTSVRPFLVAGDLRPDWNRPGGAVAAGGRPERRDRRDVFNYRSVAPFDNNQGVTFNVVISSDMTGKGIVQGTIDFDGNGITDLFAKRGDQWVVLRDGQGTWENLATSNIPVDQLRFGDVDGDGRTDVLRLGPGKKVVFSSGGRESWKELTDGPEQGSTFQVADFNGDGRADLFYMRVLPNFQMPSGPRGGVAAGPRRSAAPCT